VAIVAGTLGWFMVLRRQTFAGHTLSLVGFPGAAGAVLLGLSPALGFFAFSCGSAIVIATVPRPAGATGYGEESAVIGSVQALALGFGFLFVNLYGGNLNGLTSLLFGSFLGITNAQVLALLAVAIPTLGLLAVVARPLVFASVDPDVAAAAGVPVRWIGIGFLVLLGVGVAEAAQITGALLVFALLVLPPATSQALTGRPALGAVLSVGLAVAVTWAGLLIAFYTPYPTGAFITTLSFGAYVVARGVQFARGRPRVAPSPSTVPA
jgi:zinc/manganese transport system permease protein